MLKTTRWAILATTALTIAASAALAPLSAHAQTQPPAPTPAAGSPAASTAPSDPASAATTASPAVVAPIARGATAGRATEIVDNPYGLEAVWRGGDVVAKSTLIILVLMSMGSWYVIFTKLYEQAKMRRQARVANDTFWTAPTVREGATSLKDGSPFRFLAESGLEATNRHVGLLGNVNLNDWISMSIQRAIDNVQSRMQDGLAFLATVGSTAPFVGLFGTVWGIYHALTAIGIAGQASIDKVAGPVGEALIMTAIGLAVAVPAVLGYNWLVRRNKSAMEQVRGFGADLHAVLLSTPAAVAKA
ncbi:MAG: MotA/TolQ/ExbB proton channel family protein [Betaproteobacteria bacterium]